MSDSTSTPHSRASGGKELPAGTRLEEFVIERVLGSGGFGITYLARDASLNRQVVIKENLPSQFAHRDTTSLTVHPGPGRDDQDNFRWSMENFSREAEMLASLHHPGIVSVLRRFEAFGTAYFVMPFVEGIPFDELIEQRQRENKPFTEEELRGLLERVLDALNHLHDRGIYHRDIKPGNLLITNDGIPVLIDFGSARQRLSERSMTVIESAGFTPFEQLQSQGNVGPWSDLYALGGTLEKAITGQTPPKAMDRMRHDPRILLAERPDMQGLYSSDFLGTINKALEVEESQRWQNAEEWLAALRDRVGTAPQILPPPAALLRPQIGKRTQSMAPTHSMKYAQGSNRKTRRVTWIVAVSVLAGLLVPAKMLYERQLLGQIDKVAVGPQPMERESAGQQPDTNTPALRSDEAEPEQSAVGPDSQEDSLTKVSLWPPSESPLKAPGVAPPPPVTPPVTAFPKNAFFKMTQSNNVLYVGRRGGKSISTFEALQRMHDRGSLVLVMNMLNDPYAGSPGNVIIRNSENGPEIARLKGVARSRTYRIRLPVKPSDKIVISIENDHSDGMKLRPFQGKAPDLYLEPSD